MNFIYTLHKDHIFIRFKVTGKLLEQIQKIIFIIDSGVCPEIWVIKSIY